MQNYLATYLSSMRRIFIVMVTFGLAIGLVFPLVVNPFVTWDPERKVFFQLACLIAGFLVGGFCHLLIKTTLFRQKRELEQAKDKFTSLTQTAIRNHQWEVALHEPSIATCWEVKNCTDTSCPVHGEHNVRCWLIAGTFCDGQPQGHFAQKLETCAECEIYAGTVRQDPISEIGENFNSLMWVVHEREAQLAEANTRLKEMAVTDSLTGLKNHGHFQEVLSQELARSKRFDYPLSVIILDLDHFKNVNDKFGHQTGDAVLKIAGRFLKEEVREMDYVARYGGEEFVIVLPQTPAAAAVEVADKIRVNIKDKVATATELPPSYIGASFGVADYPCCAADKESLIAAADSALLFTKKRGRNQVSYFLDLAETDLSDEDVDKLGERLCGAGLQTIQALALAVDNSDGYSTESAELLEEVTRELAADIGMSKDQTETLLLATRLHDIGKVGVPGSILTKSSNLSPEELSQVKQHPEIARRVLHEAVAVKDLVSAILYHHECWDGTGYPEKLKGEEIPTMARVVSVADAYRAMLSDRPYRKALSVPEAIVELRKNAGSQFDPDLVELFIKAVETQDRRQQQKAS